MPKITYLHPSGERETLEVAEGTSVMRAALEHSVDGIVGECGGQLMCATCHCFVDGPLGEGAERSDDEEEMLECTSEPATARSRLSCQLVAGRDFDELEVELPQSQV
ncbi:Rhodocoxin [Pseudoclavibacter triregionum]|nr:Rhodocoxin [Pseudoclavibacter triregionum]